MPPFQFDAWNRLVTVKNSSGTTIASFSYDALSRRVQQTESSTTTDFYFSAAGQVLEERVAGTTMAQYVWSPVYVDAMILRDRSTNGGASLNERLWVMQDANFNVTALVNNSGSVVERYAYDPYGAVTILSAGFTVLSGSAYAWVYLNQGSRFDFVTGLYHHGGNGGRDLDPNLMRWIEEDPLRTGVAPWYGDEGNNPVNGLDPSGLGKDNIRPSFVIGNETVEELEKMMDEFVKEGKAAMAAGAKKNPAQGKIDALRGWIKVQKAQAKYANKFGKGRSGPAPRTGQINNAALAAAGIEALIVAGVSFYYNSAVEKCGEAAEAKVNRLMLGRTIRAALQNGELPEVYSPEGLVGRRTFYVVWRGQLLIVRLEQNGLAETLYIVVYQRTETDYIVILPPGEVPLNGGLD